MNTNLDNTKVKEIPIHLTEIDYSNKMPTLHKFVIKDKYIQKEDEEEIDDEYSNLSNINIEIKNKKGNKKDK